MVKNRFLVMVLAAAMAVETFAAPMTAQAAFSPTRTAQSNTFFSITSYSPSKGTLDFCDGYYAATERTLAINEAVSSAASFRGGKYIAVDVTTGVSNEFGSDSVWRAKYMNEKLADGSYANPYKKYYDDMLSTYPQLQTAIKNGWNDLTLVGIQQLIANGTLPADALVGRVSTAGTATVTPPAATTTTTQTPAEASIAKLQEAVVELTIHPATVYNGTDYSKEFNAAFYYIANPDLQTAIGVNAKKLLEHYVKHGKAEGRLAIAK